MLLLFKSAGPGISLVRSNSGTTGGTAYTTTATVTLPTVVAGHGIILTTSNWNGNGKAISSVVDSAGGVWVQAGSQTVTEGHQSQWYCSSHPGSAGTLTVTITFAAATSASLTLSEWSQPLVSGGTGGGVSSITVATSGGQLAVGIAARGDNTVAPPVSPSKNVSSATSKDSSNSTAYVIATTGSTTTVNWDTASSSFGVSYGIVGDKGKLKVYLGSTPSIKPVKYWNGTAWIVKPVRVWNGTAWKFTFDGTATAYTFSENSGDAGTYSGNAMVENAGDPGTYSLQGTKVQPDTNDAGTYTINP